MPTTEDEIQLSLEVMGLIAQIQAIDAQRAALAAELSAKVDELAACVLILQGGGGPPTPRPVSELLPQSD